MSGKQSRDKGRRGQSEALAVLQERGFYTTEVNHGRSTEDIVARLEDSPEIEEWDGRRVYAVEVKHCDLLKPYTWRKQAKENARKSKRRWLLMMRLPGYPYTFLVEGDGIGPVVWQGNAGRRSA